MWDNFKVDAIVNTFSDIPTLSQILIYKSISY